MPCEVKKEHRPIEKSGVPPLKVIRLVLQRHVYANEVPPHGNSFGTRQKISIDPAYIIDAEEADEETDRLLLAPIPHTRCFIQDQHVSFRPLTIRQVFFDEFNEWLVQAGTDVPDNRFGIDRRQPRIRPLRIAGSIVGSPFRTAGYSRCGRCLPSCPKGWGRCQSEPSARCADRKSGSRAPR